MDNKAKINSSKEGVKSQREVLLKITFLNIGLSVMLFIGGIVADSSGLLANALDNGSDAVTYAISYYAATRSQKWKAVAAMITGFMLLILAGGVVFDAGRRFIEGSEPTGPIMMGIAILSTAINMLCIKLLRKYRHDEVNLRASWTMSINDFVSNFGIIIAGLFVLIFKNNWPDLLVAFAIAGVAIYGSIITFRDSYRTTYSRER
jgi:cation diffusion facilitator family transporter